MLILGIDPGTRETGICGYDSSIGRPLANHLFSPGVAFCGLFGNDGVISILANWHSHFDAIVIERPTLYGKGGEALVETVIWAGRFFQAAGFAARFMTRGEVCEHWSVNGLGKGKDAIINQKLVDRYGGIDGKKKAVGTKAAPGPLFGVTGHSRQALALAIAYAETKITKGEEF